MRIPRIALVSLLVLGGAALSIGTAAAATKPATAKSSLPTITIGNEGFTESYIMQDIYGLLLQHIGYTVHYTAQSTVERSGAIAALEAGSIDITPDYAGSLLVYLKSHDQVQAGQLSTAETALNAALASKGVVVLPGTSGLDQNVFVVTDATQAKDHLTTIASIKKYASKWVFGAPPECSTYYFCEPGLKSVYGLKFKQVTSLDESGPVSVKALQDGSANMVELFSTDNVIGQDHFYVLQDNKNLEPADHLIPVVRKSIDTPALAAELAKVNSLLTTSALTQLDAAPSASPHPTPLQVAQGFLTTEKLI